VTVIDVCDSEYTCPGDRLGTHEYEQLLAQHAPLPRLEGPRDEWDAIAVSYTRIDAMDASLPPYGAINRSTKINQLSKR
jgi:hypothetical protein